ncbi:MAG: hypothetical protein AAF447_02210 [Myxococcota bacterium]
MLLATGCVDADPPEACPGTGDRAWADFVAADTDVPVEDRPGLMVLDLIAGADEQLDQRRSEVAALCANGFTQLAFALSFAEVIELPEPSPERRTCDEYLELLATLFDAYADDPRVPPLRTMRLGPSCAGPLESYLRDAVYCMDSTDVLDADAVTCSGTQRACMAPWLATEACLECTGEWSTAGVSERCQRVLLARNGVRTTCDGGQLTIFNEEDAGPRLEQPLVTLRGGYPGVAAAEARLERTIARFTPLVGEVEAELAGTRVTECGPPAEATHASTVSELTRLLGVVRPVRQAIDDGVNRLSR